MNKKIDQRQMLEGSRAIATVVKNIGVDVISAYPITPQTHIVEDLAQFKADGEADYEYVRAESEFAAASIVLGASAMGSRTYTATSSQGLLLMSEVVYNIAGMRLPIVMTCANRAVSAPISIWNDHQDAMAVRDAGWIMLFAENHQEAVNQHIIAFKLAEKLNIPVMVNVDGFILTHSYEPVYIPKASEIKKYLPKRKLVKGEILDPKNPVTLGSLAAPAVYMEIRKKLHDDLRASLKVLKDETKIFNKITPIKNSKNSAEDNGFFEYTGPKNPEIIIIAMGSMIGTIKETVKESNKKIGVLKIKLFRPFPFDELKPMLAQTKKIAVIEKALSLGDVGPLTADIAWATRGQNSQIYNYIVGLGGRDVSKKIIKEAITLTEKKNETGKSIFLG